MHAVQVLDIGCIALSATASAAFLGKAYWHDCQTALIDWQHTCVSAEHTVVCKVSLLVVAC
jgi:hypothetical protein